MTTKEMVEEARKEEDTSFETGKDATSKVEKYGNRFWAVYLDGGVAAEPWLIAVTVYKKGAKEVAKVLDSLIELRQTKPG